MQEIKIKKRNCCCGASTGGTLGGVPSNKLHFVNSSSSMTGYQGDIADGDTFIISEGVEKGNVYQYDSSKDGLDKFVLKGNLKGDKGDRGDLTEVGIASVKKFVATLDNPSVPSTTTAEHYRTLTYNNITQWGTLHLDVTPTQNVSKGVDLGMLDFPAPAPASLIEVNAIGSGGSVGQIYVSTDGTIKANDLKQGERYIVDLSGYYVEVL